MTATASRFDQFQSDSLRLAPSPIVPTSNDGLSPLETEASAPEARGQGGSLSSYHRELVARVQLACTGYKPGELAERMNLHPETVRRYLRGQKPSPEFLAGICRELNVSAQWLLLGQGSMRNE